MTAHTLKRTLGAAALGDLRGELRTLNIPTPGRRRRSTGSLTLWRHYWSGYEWQLGSAAYWESITRFAETPNNFRLGQSLLEEVGACVLGGYGIPSISAHAAFERLRDEGVFGSHHWSATRIEALLRLPFLIGEGRSVHYRFPHQKAARLASALEVLRTSDIPTAPAALRDWLMLIPGIGPKTASWIVRNHTGSNDVAIIDIHIVRAGITAGVFDPAWRVATDYQQFEQAFLQWAQHAQLEASFLDACIWGVLAHAGADARDILGTTYLSDQPRAVWPVENNRTTPLR